MKILSNTAKALLTIGAFILAYTLIITLIATLKGDWNLGAAYAGLVGVLAPLTALTANFFED